MAYLLLEADGFLKAGDFARELNLSERTVKNDMEHLRDFLKDCGCSLDSVRGKGYLLKIDRPDQFAKTREWLNILFNNVEANNREHLSYQLARAIMCRQAADEDGYFLLEELAAQLYCSASTVKKKMPWVREFFASFQLSLVTKPGHGMKLCGSELGQRLGMLELYENHFRIRVVAFENQAYERAFMDQGDKDRIRKIVLDTIRASECELFDSYVNRLVDYILLVRKRIQSGNVISKEEESQTVYHLGTIKELYATGEWELARQLLTNLREIPGYDQDSFRRDGEIAALSILFLMWGDGEQIPGLVASTQASEFLTLDSIKIFGLGALSFVIATASGVIFVKIFNLFLKKGNKINPLIGNAGVSAVPDSARISQVVGLEYDPTNYLLMHAMGPNVAGVIGSAVAAGILLGFLM